MLDYTKPLMFRKNGNRARFVEQKPNGEVAFEDPRGNRETFRNPEDGLKNFVEPTEFWAPLALAMQSTGHLAIKVDATVTSAPRAIVRYSAAKGWSIEEAK